MSYQVFFCIQRHLHYKALHGDCIDDGLAFVYINETPLS